MTKLLWDKVGERLYEAGVDRGVLYLADGSGVVWNGLISIEEDMGDDSSEPRYLDGVKYTDSPLIGDYSATLNAFTYPDEFSDFEGLVDLGNGLLVDDQSPMPFGLSYRTLVGNDIDGIDFGYKIHLVYNLTATSDATNYETVSDSTSALTFSWKLTGVPQDAPGYRPTAHVIFDSRYLDPAMLAGIEALLYGDANTTPHIPSVDELIDFVSFWNPKLIVPQTVTGLAGLINGTGDLTQIKVPGIYSALPTTRLVETAVDGLYQVVP